MYTDRTDRRFGRQHGLPIEPDYIGPIDRYYLEPVTRLDLAGPPERMVEVAQRLREAFPPGARIALRHAEPHLVQIHHPLADKGIALQRIAARLGVSKAQVMAIGASDDDLGMMEWAGFAVATANASPAVRQLADQVVPANDEHGVARALQRYVLGRGRSTPSPQRSA